MTIPFVPPIPPGILAVLEDQIFRKLQAAATRFEYRISPEKDWRTNRSWSSLFDHDPTETMIRAYCRTIAHRYWRMALLYPKK